MSKDDIVILVEFDEPDVTKVNIQTFTKEHIEKSKEAIENALNVITWIGEKAKGILDAGHEKPDEVELEFGIKIGTKAGMLVTQADAEFHIQAKLVWKNLNDGRSATDAR